MNSKKHIAVVIICILIILVAAYWFIGYRSQKVIEQVGVSYNTGNLDDAIKSAESLLEKNPNDIQALLAVAATYAQKGSVSFKEEENAKLAIEYADRVLVIDPKNSEAYRIKGYSFEIQELYSDAHSNYNKAIEFDPKNSQAYSNKGHAYDLEGNIVEAEKLYVKAIEVLPSNDHALLNLGRLYIRQEKFEDAMITLDSLFSSSPNSRFKAEGYQLLSYIKYNQEDFDGALEAIDHALKFDPNFSTAWVTKAKIELGTALDMGTEEELNTLIAQVKSDIEKALSINPNQAEAYLVLSDIEIITGDKDKELQYKKTAIEAIPLDITLGKMEKESLKQYLESEIKITNSSTAPTEENLNIDSN